MDAVWLKKIGVEGTERDVVALAVLIANELELRVGNAIAQKLTDEQIDEFETLMDESDEADTENIRINWLERVLPNYQTVVDMQTRQLQAEIFHSPNPVLFIRGL